MAKQRTKVLPSRKPTASRDEDSLLTRSAESLGRVVGSLQRQVQGTRKRMSTVAKDAMDALPELPRFGSRRAQSGRKSASRKRSASQKRAAGARKASGARKAGGRRPSARKTSRRTKRGE
jgi:hypothetical protein